MKACCASLLRPVSRAQAATTWGCRANRLGVDAVSLLHEQEVWLASHRSEIAAKIKAGYAAAQRGELIDADDVRRRLLDRKRAWLDERPVLP
jgi:hypothetical protein